MGQCLQKTLSGAEGVGESLLSAGEDKMEETGKKLLDNVQTKLTESVDRIIDDKLLGAIDEKMDSAIDTFVMKTIDGAITKFGGPKSKNKLTKEEFDAEQLEKARKEANAKTKKDAKIMLQSWGIPATLIQEMEKNGWIDARHSDTKGNSNWSALSDEELKKMGFGSGHIELFHAGLKKIEGISRHDKHDNPQQNARLLKEWGIPRHLIDSMDEEGWLVTQRNWSTVTRDQLKSMNFRDGHIEIFMNKITKATLQKSKSEKENTSTIQKKKTAEELLNDWAIPQHLIESMKDEGWLHQEYWDDIQDWQLVEMGFKDGHVSSFKRKYKNWKEQQDNQKSDQIALLRKLESSAPKKKSLLKRNIDVRNDCKITNQIIKVSIVAERKYGSFESTSAAQDKNDSTQRASAKNESNMSKRDSASTTDTSNTKNTSTTKEMGGNVSVVAGPTPVTVGAGFNYKKGTDVATTANQSETARDSKENARTAGKSRSLAQASGESKSNSDISQHEWNKISAGFTEIMPGQTLKFPVQISDPNQVVYMTIYLPSKNKTLCSNVQIDSNFIRVWEAHPETEQCVKLMEKWNISEEFIDILKEEDKLTNDVFYNLNRKELLDVFINSLQKDEKFKEKDRNELEKLYDEKENEIIDEKIQIFADQEKIKQQKQWIKIFLQNIKIEKEKKEQNDQKMESRNEKQRKIQAIEKEISLCQKQLERKRDKRNTNKMLLESYNKSNNSDKAQLMEKGYNEEDEIKLEEQLEEKLLELKQLNDANDDVYVYWEPTTDPKLTMKNKRKKLTAQEQIQLKDKQERERDWEECDTDDEEINEIGKFFVVDGYTILKKWGLDQFAERMIDEGWKSPMDWIHLDEHIMKQDLGFRPGHIRIFNRKFDLWVKKYNEVRSVIPPRKKGNDGTLIVAPYKTKKLESNRMYEFTKIIVREGATLSVKPWSPGNRQGGVLLIKSLQEVILEKNAQITVSGCGCWGSINPSQPGYHPPVRPPKTDKDSKKQISTGHVSNGGGGSTSALGYGAGGGGYATRGQNGVSPIDLVTLRKEDPFRFKTIVYNDWFEQYGNNNNDKELFFGIKWKNGILKTEGWDSKKLKAEVKDEDGENQWRWKYDITGRQVQQIPMDVKKYLERKQKHDDEDEQKYNNKLKHQKTSNNVDDCADENNDGTKSESDDEDDGAPRVINIYKTRNGPKQKIWHYEWKVNFIKGRPKEDNEVWYEFDHWLKNEFEIKFGGGGSTYGSRWLVPLWEAIIAIEKRKQKHPDDPEIPPDVLMTATRQCLGSGGGCVVDTSKLKRKKLKQVMDIREQRKLIREEWKIKWEAQQNQKQNNLNVSYNQNRLSKYGYRNNTEYQKLNFQLKQVLGPACRRGGTGGGALYLECKKLIMYQDSKIAANGLKELTGGSGGSIFLVVHENIKPINDNAKDKRFKIRARGGGYENEKNRFTNKESKDEYYMKIKPSAGGSGRIRVDYDNCYSANFRGIFPIPHVGTGDDFFKVRQRAKLQLERSKKKKRRKGSKGSRSNKSKTSSIQISVSASNLQKNNSDSAEFDDDDNASNISDDGSVLTNVSDYEEEGFALQLEPPKGNNKDRRGWKTGIEDDENISDDDDNNNNNNLNRNNLLLNGNNIQEEEHKEEYDHNVSGLEIQSDMQNKTKRKRGCC